MICWSPLTGTNLINMLQNNEPPANPHTVKERAYVPSRCTSFKYLPKLNRPLIGSKYYVLFVYLSYFVLRYKHVRAEKLILVTQFKLG